MVLIDEINIFVKIFLWSVPVAFAIILHEVAHGAVAYFFGDDSAKKAGRLSVNPIKHLDFLGSILIPGLLFFFSSFIFGWAKPVPINQQNLKSPKLNMIYVALAGPLANLIMSFFWALIIKAGYLLSVSFADLSVVLIYMGAAGVFINAAIMMLNLLPFLPLDGGRVVVNLLPSHYAVLMSKMQPWGFVLLLILIVTGVAAKLLWPLIALQMTLVTYITNTPADLFIEALRAIF